MQRGLVRFAWELDDRQSGRGVLDITLGVMSRTLAHLLYATLWLTGFTVVVAAMTRGANPDFGQMGFYAQVGSIVWALGFNAIFYSWARKDAPAHGKSAKSAAVFAALWLFFNVVAHEVYLFFTRGFRNGLLATLKFVCFVLAAGIAWFAFSRALGTIL